jgi:hypothetical protein
MRWQTGPGGVVVSMENPGAAAAAFRHLAASKEERIGIGRAARALAETRYAPGPVCDRLGRVFAEIARRPGFWTEGAPVAAARA